MSDQPLTTREALAETLAEHHWAVEVAPPEGVDPYLWCICGWRSDEATDEHWTSGAHARLAHLHIADALLASGALTDATKLAADEALVERVAIGAAVGKLWRALSEDGVAEYLRLSREHLTALAAALSAQSERAEVER